MFPGSPDDDIARLSSIHMAQILAGVVGDVVGRLTPDLRQAMFDEMARVALENGEHVISARPEHVKRHVRALTQTYVMAALRQVAAELNLAPPLNSYVKGRG